jgi:AcrR family transcriptional regulator
MLVDPLIGERIEHLDDARDAQENRDQYRAARGRKEMLRQKGYSGVSTRDVAAEAGVPLSQIHYHFGSKQGASEREDSVTKFT